MILEESLKGLKVAVRGGGKLISHRPVFSPDGSSLYIIQSHKVLTYSTSTGLHLSTYTTPGATQIANIHAPEDNPNSLVVFTTTGRLLHVNLSKGKITSSRQVNVPKSWTPIPTFTNFLYPSSSTPVVPHFLMLGYPQDAALPVLYSVSLEEDHNQQPDNPTISKLCWAVLPSQHFFAMSGDGRFVVAIQEDALYCKDMKDPKNCSWHSAGTRKFTCVAIHPTQDFICATGDDSGRVLIWTNVMTEKSPAKTVFHWHTLPVIDLAFTPEGSQMVSGGGECTLLKWDVSDTTNKRTLPRMGLPIRHVSCSPTGELVAVSHADNCVQLVDPYNKIVGVVKNFTQSYIPDEGEEEDEGETEEGKKSSNVFPAGINIDPKNSCLVLNGRPGWLQCYDVVQDKHIYSLDVAQQNYVTAERERAIPNTEVWNVAFSKSGLWMATVEGRMSRKGKEEETSQKRKCTELKLKFWKRDEAKAAYVLNTCVDWPHEAPLHSLRFRPVPENDDGLVLISTGGGSDRRLKVWAVAENQSVHGLSEYWYLEHTRTYKDMPAGPASFSSDGSLLGACFSRLVTLWDVSGYQCEFKLSLCHARLTETLNLCEFGQTISSHLLICCSDSKLIVWDVITASLLWVAPIRIQSLCVDPLSNLVAAATVDFHLVFFTPDSPKPRAVHKNVSKSAILSSAFVPNRRVMERVGLKSTLLFLNESQELCAVVPKKGDGETSTSSLDVLRVGGESKLTPFAEMFAEKQVNEPGKKKRKSRGGALSSSGQKAYSILREIMDQSPHTMPSVTYYCSQLMRALSTPSTESDRLAQIENLVQKGTTGRKKKRYGAASTDDDDDSDSDGGGGYTTDATDPMDSTMDSQGSIVSRDSNASSVELDSCSKLLQNVNLDEVVEDDSTWIECVFKK